MMEKYVELLAPAGNYDAFVGAINAGADAVYLGGERFGARAYADNFKTEEILQALHVAHFYGKRIYLTVNTLLKEREIGELSEYLTPFYEEGLDGVIIQDMGALGYIREHFPGLALHASTQMTVTGVRGAALLKEAGVSRIVPARELSLREVRNIREKAGVEVECFIHGAMCYSYSGQCLFSSMLGGRSGNRGRCAQPCRLPYEIFEGKKRLAGEGYPLSLKDMCTLACLPALIGAGIDSFKIEGRMKRAEYAAGVTAVYRKYIDRYYEEGEAGSQVRKADLNRLKSLYIRSEIQTGYYERHNGKEMITLKKPGYEECDEALLTEVREAYLAGTPKMPVWLYARAAVGEPLRVRIVRDTDVRSVPGGEKGQIFGSFCGNRPEAEGFLTEITGETVQPAKNAPLTEDDVRKRLMKMGESLLAVTVCEIEMEGEGFVPVRAINELRREAVKAFEAAVCEARKGRRMAEDGNKSAEVSVKSGTVMEEVEFRRNLKKDRPSQSTREAAQSVSAAADRRRTEDFRNRVIDGDADNGGVHALVATLEQLRAAVSCGCERIYIESDLFVREREAVSSRMKSTGEAKEGETVLSPKRSCAYYLALPYVLRERDDDYLNRLEDALRESEAHAGVQGFLVRSLEGLAFARRFCGETGPKENGYSLVADAGLYCFNGEAASFLASYVDEITLPYELNAGEAAHLAGLARDRGVSVNLIVYSHIPMMVTANCLARTADACLSRETADTSAESGAAAERRIFLKDRKEVLFPVVLNCEHCYNVIYNSLPYSLHGAVKERERIGADALRYDFTTETGEDCGRILRGTYAFSGYTAGHCKRGVK